MRDDHHGDMHPVHPAVVRAKTSRAWRSAGNRDGVVRTVHDAIRRG
jgi:hypothetical protein